LISFEKRARTLHKWKGSLSLFYSGRISSLAAHLEAKANFGQIQGVEELMEKCDHEFLQLLEDLQLARAELADELRKRWQDSHCYLILLTAEEKEKAEKIAHSAGFDECFTKPLQFPDLQKALQKAERKFTLARISLAG
jgi:CheY-like chemotaxis protein